MGCKKSKSYVAKETYHPFDNEWEGFTTKSFDEEDSRVRYFETIASNWICTPNSNGFKFSFKK